MRIFGFLRAITVRSVADQAAKALRTSPRKRTRKQRAVINLWRRM